MPDPLLDLLAAYRKLKVISVACELALFTRLAREPLTADEIAERCGAQPAPLLALLEVCVALGLLRLEGQRYSLLPMAEIHLVEGKPGYLGHLLHIFSAEAPQWEALNHLVTTGETPLDMASGDVDSSRFTLAMHTLGVLGEAEALADMAPLAGRRDLVDVGCGSGVYSIALCRRFPQLRATLLDTEEVLGTTQEIVAASRVEDRITLTPADILSDGYGRGRDAVLMSDVLYLGEDVCLAQLNSAFDALAPGGQLVVRGYFSDPDSSHPPWGALFDLARMVWDGSRRPITHARLRGWLEQVGFEWIELFPLTERSTCALARRGS